MISSSPEISFHLSGNTFSVFCLPDLLRFQVISRLDNWMVSVDKQLGVWTRCILKTEQILYTVPVSDFLFDLICSVQLDEASVKNREVCILHGVERRAASSGITSIVWNGCDRVPLLPCSRNATQPGQVEVAGYLLCSVISEPKYMDTPPPRFKISSLLTVVASNIHQKIKTMLMTFIRFS